MPTERQRLETSYHESGHAFMAAHLGFPLALASIVEDHDSRGRVRYQKCRLDFDSVPIAARSLPVIMAGAISQEMQRVGVEHFSDAGWDAVKAVGDDGDRQKATKYAKIVGGAVSKTPDQILRHSAKVTARILRDNWSAVESIAAALLERGELDGDDIQERIDLAHDIGPLAALV